jgi:hypothetical protein
MTVETRENVPAIFNENATPSSIRVTSAPRQDDLADLPPRIEEISRLIVAARRRDRRKVREDQKPDADEALGALAGIQEHPLITYVRQDARGHDDDEVDGGRDPADTGR